VREEYRVGERSTTGIALVDDIFQTVECPVNAKLLPYFHFRSISGEIEVISCALADRKLCCVIDEEFGRSICRLFDVKLTGAVGIIRKMREEHLVQSDEIRLVKSKLKASTFYLSDRLLNEL
jgi:predicted nucleic acid-binding protein